MPEILLCNHTINPQRLNHECGVDIDSLFTMTCQKPAMLVPNTPYLVSDDQFGTGRGILNQLSSRSAAKELTTLSLSYGGDNLVAMAEVIEKLKEYNIGLIGASTSVYASRIGGFAGSVRDYQKALMDYRQAVKSRSPMRTAMKQKAHVAFQKMQTQFQHELRVVTFKNKARRGTPLTSANRATNIANSSRSVARLNVTDQIQASNLVKFSRYTKFLGNGLAVIDFSSRVGNIHNSYKSGGNWERDLFIESSSFAAGAFAGIVAVDAGVTALGFLMVATPIGWVGLVVGGLAVAGAAAAVSMGASSFVKDKGGSGYDDIMSVLGRK